MDIGHRMQIILLGEGESEGRLCESRGSEILILRPLLPLGIYLFEPGNIRGRRRTDFTRVWL